MEGAPHPIPRTVEEVFSDFKGRRSGLIKALTTGTLFISISFARLEFVFDAFRFSFFVFLMRIALTSYPLTAFGACLSCAFFQRLASTMCFAISELVMFNHDSYFLMRSALTFYPLTAFGACLSCAFFQRKKTCVSMDFQMRHGKSICQ